MKQGIASDRTTSSVAEWARFPERVARVAFLTPPSSRPILRDYYSTSRSKADYLWAPIDLWVQGAMVSPLAATKMFEGSGRTADALLDDLRSWGPDLLVALVGGFTAQADVAFLDRLWAEQRVPVVIGGEAVMRGWPPWADRPWAVALLRPFVGTELRNAVRSRQGLPSLPSGPRAVWGRPPEWPVDEYRYPLLGSGVPSVLSAHGCPFRCSYCNNNRDVLGLTVRDDEDFFAELEVWAARGVRRLHVRDVNFGGPATRAKALLARWAKMRLPFRWNCFLRPETIDEEMADLLQQAGCVQVQMGVETASAAVRRAVRRGGDEARVEDAFARLAARRIRRGAHFVLGLPGETGADLAATIAWARRLDPDYASFNIGIVRGGTAFAGELGDCSSGEGGLLSAIDGLELAAWRRRAERSVYMRPRFLTRTLRTLARDPALLAALARDGVSVARRAFLDTGQGGA